MYTRFILGIVLSLSLATPALTEETLTNADVLELHAAGLPASVIVAKVKSTPSAFDTSVEALIALAEAGVPDDVVAAMVESNSIPSRQEPPPTQVVHSGKLVQQQSATVAPTVANTFGGTPCTGPGIFVESDEGLRQIDPSSYTGAKTSGLWKARLTYGAISVKSKAMITGLTSHNRVQNHSPVFYFCFEETQTGLSYETSGATTPGQFLLVTLDVNDKQNARLLVTGKFNVHTGGYSGPPPKYRCDFTYDKIAPGVYKVTANGLLPGEYAFFYTGSASTTAATTYGLVSSGGNGKVFDFSVG